MAAGFEPDPVARKIAAHLAKHGMEFQIAENGRLHVPLPNGFGALEIGALGESAADSICGLVGHAWHTHGDQFGASGIDEQCAALSQFVAEVFSGGHFLIEEVSAGKGPRKTIEESLERYLQYLPEGTTYKVFNRVPPLPEHD